jgi:hypothetical protein
MLKYVVCTLFTGALVTVPPAIRQEQTDVEGRTWVFGYESTFRKGIEIQPPIPPDAKVPQWWALAREVGWAEDQLLILDMVIYRESRGNPDAWNKQDPFTGSRGLTQVNGSWRGWLRDKGIITRNADLFDPRVNLTAALAMWQYGMDRYDWGWGPWRVPQG